MSLARRRIRTLSDSVCRYGNRLSATDFVTDGVTCSVTDGERVDVFEVFSCEATEVREADAVACGVRNVADKASLRNLLRLKACIGNGFQLSVTL